MTEVGETANRVQTLLQEAIEFEKQCNNDLDAASLVIDEGEVLMKDPLSSVDHIESKCEELRRTSSLLIEKIQKRNMLLTKAREVMDRIDKANDWCATGVEILAGEGGLIAVDKSLEDAKSFGLTSPEQFRDMLMQSATPETRALVTQVMYYIR
ncbi:Guanine nucleotide exchange factor DBS, partial [Danaus plexippus plexippus]